MDRKYMASKGSTIETAVVSFLRQLEHYVVEYLVATMMHGVQK